MNSNPHNEIHNGGLSALPSKENGFVDVEFDASRATADGINTNTAEKKSKNTAKSYLCQLWNRRRTFFLFAFAFSALLLFTVLCRYVIYAHKPKTQSSNMIKPRSSGGSGIAVNTENKGAEAAWINARYAYKAKKNINTGIDHSHGHKEDQIVPLSVFTENGVVHTTRVGHSHLKPVYIPRGGGDEISATAEAADQTHYDVVTRTRPITTDDTGEIHYGPTVVSTPHTHANEASVPLVPAINPSMTNGNIRASEYPPKRSLEVMIADVPATTISQISNEPVVTTIPKLGFLVAQNTTTSVDIEVTAQPDTDTKSGISDIDSANQYTGPSGDGQPITSTIFDEFWNITYTVTPIESGSWRHVLPEVTSPPHTTPLGSIVGPPITVFDPIVNVTWEGNVYDLDGDQNIDWQPVTTGTPTRAEDIAKASSWRAAGGEYPAFPTPQLVFDPHTNTTWNESFQGDIFTWTAVFTSLTTGTIPAFTHPTVPYLPEWPGRRGWGLRVTNSSSGET